jgi:D-methionine transport system ATP-binding protein
LIALENLVKTFHSGDRRVEALRGVSLEVAKADVMGVIGPSGAGKSTLVRCINLLERPDSGRVLLDGVDLTSLPERELRRERKKIGMIFQHFNLLRSLTALENVAFPLERSWGSRGAPGAKAKAKELLELVGLEDKGAAYPSQLSGGEKQRVAIARSLATDPEILLSDEATSALDPEATASVLALLSRLNASLGLTIVIITHQMDVVKDVATRVAVIEKGRIIEEGATKDVFAFPREGLTRSFVSSVFQTDRALGLVREGKIAPLVKDGGRAVRLLFTGPSANRAYISELSRAFGIDASIFFGNIEIVQGSPIGSLYAVLNGERASVAAAIAWLEAGQVRVLDIEEA